jgi:sugar/nucleoside kinase (ribokinase family)
MYDFVVGFSANKEETVIQPQEKSSFSKITISSLPRSIAGSSVNVARALNVLGATVKLLCTVGKDSHASDILDLLTNWGIDSFPIPVRDGTPRTIVFVPEGKHKEVKQFCYKPGYRNNSMAHAITEVKEQTIVCQPKCCVATGVRVDDLPLVRTLFDGSGIKVLNPNISLIQEHRQVFLDLCGQVDLVVVNHEEAAALLGKDPNSFNAPDDVMVFTDSTRAKEVLVTFNSHGSSYCQPISATKYNYYHVPSEQCEVIDPTGAGDAYLAGYLFSRLRGENVDGAMRFATKLAGIKVTKIGGSNIPTKEEIEKITKK